MKKSLSQVLAHKFTTLSDHRLTLTMVPDLRIAVKVGAYSMSDEIRTDLEATCMSNFTASSAKKYICWHIIENLFDSMIHRYPLCTRFVCVCVCVCYLSCLSSSFFNFSASFSFCSSAYSAPLFPSTSLILHLPRYPSFIY